MPQKQEYLNFQQIKDTASVPVILASMGLYDSFTTKGNEWVGQCPFGHKNGSEDASFSFNSEKKVFQCFTYKKHGTILDFYVLMEKEHGEPNCTVRDAGLFIQSTMQSVAHLENEQDQIQYFLDQTPPKKPVREPARSSAKRPDISDADLIILKRALEIINDHFNL